MNNNVKKFLDEYINLCKKHKIYIRGENQSYFSGFKIGVFDQENKVCYTAVWDSKINKFKLRKKYED
jgi:hypothetical protein